MDNKTVQEDVVINDDVQLNSSGKGSVFGGEESDKWVHEGEKRGGETVTTHRGM